MVGVRVSQGFDVRCRTMDHELELALLLDRLHRPPERFEVMRRGCDMDLLAIGMEKMADPFAGMIVMSNGDAMMLARRKRRSRVESRRWRRGHLTKVGGIETRSTSSGDAPIISVDGTLQHSSVGGGAMARLGAIANVFNVVVPEHDQLTCAGNPYDWKD